MKKDILIGIIIGVSLLLIGFIATNIVDYKIEKSKTEIYRNNIEKVNKNRNKEYRILIKNIHNNSVSISIFKKNNNIEHNKLVESINKTNKEISTLIYVIQKNDKDMKKDLNEIKMIYSNNLIVKK